MTADEFMRAAIAFDLKTEDVHGLNSIDRALSKGKLVVAIGAPKRSGAHWTRLVGKNRPLFVGEPSHAIVIVGKCHDDYVINDPALVQGPQQITPKELWTFLLQLESSLALWV